MLLRINAFTILAPWTSPPAGPVKEQDVKIKPLLPTLQPSAVADRPPYYFSYPTNNKHTPPNRTQRKLWLQRQSFLADDINCLDHPANMKRLTKEMERVEREYRYLRQFQDPLLESLRRLLTLRQPVAAPLNDPHPLCRSLFHRLHQKSEIEVKS